MHGAHRIALTLLLAAVLTTGVRASAPSALEEKIYQSVLAGDYPRAAGYVEQFLAHSPHHPIMLYNAACIYSQLGRTDRAASSLRRAVDAGLTDLGLIERDADLAPLRDHPTYKAVIRRLTKSASNKARDAMGHWRSLYGDDQYHYSRDEDRRIAYATALDPTSHTEMRRMIERQVDYLQASIFDTSPSSFLLIAVPTPPDARKLFNNENTGGIYEHEKRRVISRDTGSSLRHELVHAYHYAHMDRLGQRHPLWVQEGIAALHESYVLDEDGTITYLPNERHNRVRGLVKSEGLRRWKRSFIAELSEIPRETTICSVPAKRIHRAAHTQRMPAIPEYGCTDCKPCRRPTTRRTQRRTAKSVWKAAGP